MTKRAPLKGELVWTWVDDDLVLEVRYDGTTGSQDWWIFNVVGGRGAEVSRFDLIYEEAARPCGDELLVRKVPRVVEKLGVSIDLAGAVEMYKALMPAWRVRAATDEESHLIQLQHWATNYYENSWANNYYENSEAHFLEGAEEAQRELEAIGVDADQLQLFTRMAASLPRVEKWGHILRRSASLDGVREIYEACQAVLER